MIRRALLTGVLVVAATGTAVCEARAPVAIGVAEREFRISAYRKVVKPGPVKFNVTNYGEDTHDLVVRGPRGFQAASAEIDSGARTSLTVTFRRPGTYTLLCMRANHASLGMRAKLLVRR